MFVDTQLYNVYMSSKHIKKHEIWYNIVMENNTKTTKAIEISVAEYERLKKFRRGTASKSRAIRGSPQTYKKETIRQF